MIRRWLLKHRLINELLKIIIVVALGFFSYACWEGGKLASVEVSMPDTYKLMYFGLVAGIIGTVALVIFVDVVYSLLNHYRGKK